MATVRKLVTSWGFNVDFGKLNRLDNRMLSVKRSASYASLAITSIATAFVGLAREGDTLEKTEIAMQAFADSSEEAKKNMKDILEFAKKTPMHLADVLSASKQILAFQFEGIPLIDMLEKVAAVSSAFGTDSQTTLRFLKAISDIQSKAALGAEEKRQLINLNIPIMRQLAEDFAGGDREKLEDIISKRGITFDRFYSSLETMAGPEGKFGKLLEKMKDTLGGSTIILMNRIRLLIKEVGQEFLPEAKQMVKEAIKFVTVNEKLIKENLVKFFRALGDSAEILIQAFKTLYFIVRPLVNSLGGLENTLKILSFILGARLIVSGLTAIGTALKFIGGTVIVKGLSSIVTSLKFIKGLKLTAFISGLSKVNIILGAIAAGMLLIADEFRVFKEGGKTLIPFQKIIDSFNNAINNFRKFKERLNKEKIAETPGNGLSNIANTFRAHPYSTLKRFNNNNTPNNNNVTANINVNVPEGADANNIGNIVKNYVVDVFDTYLNVTSTSNVGAYSQ